MDGHTYKYDISLPYEQYYELVEVMRERLDGKATRVVGYGHVGDGRYTAARIAKLQCILKGSFQRPISKLMDRMD